MSGRGGSARAEVLGRVRAALGDASAPPEPPRAYRRRGALATEQVVALFADRAGEYRAEVARVERDGLDVALKERCRGLRLAIPVGLPDAWRPAGAELVEDRGLAPRELDGLGGALTGCALAIAETGTIVLDGGERSGRRALTLVPDLHVCVVEAEQVVELVPEAVERLASAAREGRPLTFVSGPSATSDIELSRVEGVHGPRRLQVLVAG